MQTKNCLNRKNLHGNLSTFLSPRVLLSINQANLKHWYFTFFFAFPTVNFPTAEYGITARRGPIGRRETGFALFFREVFSSDKKLENYEFSREWKAPRQKTRFYLMRRNFTEERGSWIYPGKTHRGPCAICNELNDLREGLPDGVARVQMRKRALAPNPDPPRVRSDKNFHSPPFWYCSDKAQILPLPYTILQS